MPTTRRQLGFAAMSSTPKGRAELQAKGKEPMLVEVGKEMMKASKGKKLPERAPGYGR